MRHDQKHIFNESLMNAVARVERNVIGECEMAERREIGFHFTSFGFIFVGCVDSHRLYSS